MIKERDKIEDIFIKILNEIPSSVSEEGERVRISYGNTKELEVSFSNLERLKSELHFDELNIEREGVGYADSCGMWGGDLDFVIW